jgi:hypothetical protein
MTRFLRFVSPLRWPATLLLLGANLTSQVPQDSRDAYQLVVVGSVMLLALRIALIDHEAREDRKAEAREARLQLQDEGVEAAKKMWREKHAELAAEQATHAGRLAALEAWQAETHTRLAILVRVEKMFFPGS